MRRGILFLVIVAVLSMAVHSYINDWPVLHKSEQELISFTIANSDTQRIAMKRAVRSFASVIGNQFEQAQTLKRLEK